MTKYTGKCVRRHWTLAQRLAHYTAPPNERGCTEWTGPCIHRGYGKHSWKDRVQLAHRLAWEAVNGPIPDGLQVLHHCDNPPCVNVDHLFLGTHADNMHDMFSKGRRRNKLTAGDARAILADPRRQIHIADDYGISPSSVANIKYRRTWKHI